MHGKFSFKVLPDNRCPSAKLSSTPTKRCPSKGAPTLGTRYSNVFSYIFLHNIIILFPPYQPPGATATYNGKCYIFYNQQPKNFQDALEFCQSRGGSLVDESNPALQGFLSWELWRRHKVRLNLAD